MPKIVIIFFALACCLLVSCDNNKQQDEPPEETGVVEAAEAVAIVDVTSSVEDATEFAQDYAAQSINEQAEEEYNSLYEQKIISQDDLKIFYDSIFDTAGIDTYLETWECFGFENSETIQFLGKTLDMFSCTNNALEYMLKNNIEKENTLRKGNIAQTIEDYEANFERGFASSIYNDFFPVKLIRDQHDGEAFGYVNSNAVRWLRQNTIPSPNMDISGVPAQDLYDHVLKNFCRSMMFYYRYLHNELNIEKELLWYNRMISDADRQVAGEWLVFRYNQKEYPQPGISMSEKQLPSYFIGFWLRRTIDGSDSELRQGLEDILQAYDQAWLEKLNQQFQ